MFSGIDLTSTLQAPPKISPNKTIFYVMLFMTKSKEYRPTYHKPSSQMDQVSFPRMHLSISKITAQVDKNIFKKQICTLKLILIKSHLI